VSTVVVPNMANRSLGNKWYHTLSGDTCDVIIAKYGITLLQFYTWNPAESSSVEPSWV
jgi:hypothetical protein